PAVALPEPEPVLVKYAYAPNAAAAATTSVARRTRPFFDLMNSMHPPQGSGMTPARSGRSSGFLPAEVTGGMGFRLFPLIQGTRVISKRTLRKMTWVSRLRPIPAVSPARPFG